MGSVKEKNSNIAFFLTGCLMGILCFAGVYGVKILNVTYDAWLLNGDIDLMQHYIGWGHFRNSPWSFPFGLITTLSKPYPMSVIYTDSIPAVAVFFKFLSPVLPETFQYFGLYGCFSFAMQGGTAMLLLKRFLHKRWLIVLGTFFFILSFPILQRMYYHTALASQWVILLSFLLWFYEKEGMPVYKKCIKWGLMGFLCVAVHSYFLPMTGAVMLFCILEQVITAKKTGGNIKRNVTFGIFQTGSFCLAALFNLWILGGFYGGASAIGGGIGTFESNLNTFYNPLGGGITGISLPLYYDFQYEGFAYLGLGLLMLMLAILIGGIGLVIIKRPEEKIVTYFKIHHRQFLILLLFLLFILLASGPIITWNAHKIIAIPLPGIVGKIADIFRSNGRMIWVSLYLLMLAIFVCTERMMRQSVMIVAVVLSLLIQVLDLSPEVVKKQAYFNREQSHACVWENATMQQIMGDKTEFILIGSSTQLMMDSAYYAMKHGMCINRFYYARNIDDRIDAQKEEYLQELGNGQAREDAVYVFEQEGFQEAAYPDLVCYEAGDHVVGVKRK